MAEISLAPNDKLRLTLPSNHVEGEHSVLVPCTADGLKIIRQVLRKRRDAPQAKIGEEASPTQAQVDAWLKARQEEVKVNLEELGL